MAVLNKPFGKDNPERFIDKALTGGDGPSNGIHTMKVDRPNQTINTAVPMDNVKLAMPIESSILDMGNWPGGPENLKHSLIGASAEDEEVGAAGKTHKTVIPDH